MIKHHRAKGSDSSELSNYLTLLKMILFEAKCREFSSIIFFMPTTCRIGPYISNYLSQEVLIKMMNTEILSADISKIQTIFESLTIDSCTFCLGLTGSGKSSLICYLCGAPVTCQKKGARYHITHSDPDFPVIGNTSVSCTTIPRFYSFDRDLAFYDPPGFLDSNGVPQEILNAFSNSKMFREGMKAKIIIVIEISSLLSGRGEHLKNVVKRLVQLFDVNFKNIMASCLLVVTKAINPIQDIIAQVVQIGKTFQTAQNNEEMQCSQLINSLVTMDRIVAFPSAELITEQKVAQIRRQVRLLDYFKIVKQPQISLSFEARDHLSQLLKSNQKSLCDLAQSIGLQYKLGMNKQYTKEELNQAILKLESSKMIITNRQFYCGDTQLTEFKQNLNIRPANFDKLLTIFIQIRFSISVCPKLEFSSTMTNILLKHIAEVENKLKDILSKMCSKEQLEKVQKETAESIQKMTNQLKIQAKQKQKEARDREQRLRKEAKQQNNQSSQRMENLMTQLKLQNQKREKEGRQREDRLRKEAKDANKQYTKDMERMMDKWRVTQQTQARQTRKREADFQKKLEQSKEAQQIQERQFDRKLNFQREKRCQLM